MTAASLAAPAAPRDLAGDGGIPAAGADLRERVADHVVGLDEVVEQVLIAILVEGHALLEGVPGLAKTLLVSTVARLLDLEFSRIQFTPDLMPGDITGGEVLVQDASGHREFRFLKGPLFANVVLADEINRTPPKTQAALMEAMEERHVTSLGVRRPLDRPFFVLATQNPIEQQGTYPLPIGQLDRFLVKVRLGYPSAEEEALIVRRTTSALAVPDATPVVSRARLLEFQRAIAETPVRDDVARYAVDLVRASRPAEAAAPAMVKDYVTWGAGPRAAQSLVAAARARALLRGRDSTGFDDVRALARPVFRHRLVPSYAAEADGISPDDITTALLETVPYPGKPAPRRESRWGRLVRRLFPAAADA